MCSGCKHQRVPGEQHEQFDFSSWFLFCSLVSALAEAAWVKLCNLNFSFSNVRDLNGAECHPCIPFLVAQHRNFPWTDTADFGVLREGCAGNIPFPVPLETLPASALHVLI